MEALDGGVGGPEPAVGRGEGVPAREVTVVEVVVRELVVLVAVEVEGREDSVVLAVEVPV